MESLRNIFSSPLAIVSAVIMVLVVSAGRAALTSYDDRAKVRSGMAWLEYGKYFKLYSFLGSLIPFGLIFLWFNVSADNKSAILYMIILFGGLTLPLFLESFFVKIGFDDSTVYCYSPWRPSRQIKFSDMGEPHYSESMNWWVIPTKNQGKIRLQVFISGASDLLEKLQSHKDS